MKRKAIVEETRLIRDANERLPVDERNEAKVKGLYKSAQSEVEKDREFNPEKYMYMSDDDMAEIVKQKFEEKINDLPGMKPDETEKPEDVEAVEDEFADQMDEQSAMAEEMPEEGEDFLDELETEEGGDVEDMFSEGGEEETPEDEETSFEEEEEGSSEETKTKEVLEMPEEEEESPASKVNED